MIDDTRNCTALAGHTSLEQFETLRIWESPTPVVVVGSSTKIADEVKLDVCRRRRACAPAYQRRHNDSRRPRLLNVRRRVELQVRPGVRSIDAAHNFVLNSITAALNARLENRMVVRAGTSDLAIGTRKFSGNALRCRRHFLLYHGTVLYNFPLATISKYQLLPSRQPKYREQRSHDDFVMNLPLDRESIQAAFKNAFQANQVLNAWPQETTQRLATEKYSQSEWNERL